MHLKALDKEQQRCDQDDSAGNTTKCITEYLEQKIGCSMDLQDSSSVVPRFYPYFKCIWFHHWNIFFHRCNDTEQFKDYANINNKLYKANETQIYDLTGCLSNCNKYHYDAEPMTGVIAKEYESGTYEEEYRPTFNFLDLQFIFKDGHHEVKEEVKLLNN